MGKHRRGAPEFPSHTTRGSTRSPKKRKSNREPHFPASRALTSASLPGSQPPLPCPGGDGVGRGTQRQRPGVLPRASKDKGARSWLTLVRRLVPGRVEPGASAAVTTATQGKLNYWGRAWGSTHTSATAFVIGSLTLNAPELGRPRRLSQPSLHRLRAHCIYRLHFLFWLRFCHILK